MRRNYTKEELKEKYDRFTRIEWNRTGVEAALPIFIQHGFEPSENENQDGEPIKFDFRGINRFEDFYIHAPEAEVWIEHFDCSTDGDGIIAFIKKDWSKRDEEIKIFWREPTRDQVVIGEVAEAQHISTPNSRGRRKEEN